MVVHEVRAAVLHGPARDVDPVVGEPRLQRHLPAPDVVAAGVPERDRAAAAGVLEHRHLRVHVVERRADDVRGSPPDPVRGWRGTGVVIAKGK